MSCSLLENAKIQYYSQSLAQTKVKIKSESVDIGGQSIQHQLLSMKPTVMETLFEFRLAF